MPGFAGLTLSRCVERPAAYLLLVEWDRLEDHTEGFRGSPAYEDWRGLLPHFYDPFPGGGDYVTVLTAEPRGGPGSRCAPRGGGTPRAPPARAGAARWPPGGR